MIRRTLVAATALTVSAALLLTGCGRAGGSTAGGEAIDLTDGPATGTITVWAQGTEAEALQEFVKPFEEANPDVTVTVTPVPWGSALNKYQTAIAAGATPDIGMIGSDWMPTLVNALQPTPRQIDTSDIFPFALASTEYNGARHGVPWYVETRLIFYRTDLVTQAGFDEFPTDWAGLSDLAAALKDRGARYAIALQSGGWSTFLGILPFVWSNDADLLSPDGSEWTLDSPETVAAVEYLNGFFTSGLANTNPDAESSSTVASFVDGSVPMFLSGPWDIPGLLTAGGEDFADKFSVARIPASPTGESTSFAAGSHLAVFNGSQNADSAWKLIQWLTQPEVQVEWFKTVKGFPSQQSAWQDTALTSDPKVAVFGEQLQSVKMTPNLQSWTQVSAAADTQLERVFRGGVPASEALAELQSIAEGLGVQ